MSDHMRQPPFPRGGDTAPQTPAAWLRGLFLAGHVKRNVDEAIPARLDAALCLGYLLAFGYEPPGGEKGMNEMLAWLRDATDAEVEELLR